MMAKQISIQQQFQLVTDEDDEDEIWNKFKEDDERINRNGGAIALGHPLGMSGARIVYSAALELQKQSKQYALATMCVGVGQGYAVILQRA